MTVKCSIIIRTKNEERWIAKCLQQIHKQTFQDFEIILVDNESTDKTVEKAKSFGVTKIVSISNYLPGKSINAGVEIAKGDYIVLISAHCLPVNDKWLESLVSAIEEDDSYAGVYGRQEPMTFSSLSDKRDLLLVFGLDRKIQIKDSFFHNANSIVRKDVLKEIPFDSKTTNIEDRLWGQEIIKNGLKILYEPEASVFHYHGIHQDGNIERLKNVVRIINNSTDFKTGTIDISELEIVAILPVKGKSARIGDRSRLSYTIESAVESKYISKVFISTDDEENREEAKRLNCLPLSLRPSYLSENHIPIVEVVKYALEEIEEKHCLPDLVVYLEEIFPFRTKGFLDEIIKTLLLEGNDSILPAIREPSMIFKDEDNDNFVRIDGGDIPREFKEETYTAIKGLGLVTHPEFIRNYELLGKNVGLLKIDDQLSKVEVRGERVDPRIAKLLEEHQAIKNSE
tara:strand:+ start:3815 stop:5182 length:1368 start_codon:yes stop_codon:yes gene_type:complete